MPAITGHIHPGGATATWRRRTRRVAVLVGAALTLALLVSLINATTANALGIEPLPISPVTVAVPIAKAIVSAPLKAVTNALLGVLQDIFGGVEAKVLTAVINGLLAIPNFNGGHVAALEHTTSALSLGMLGSVLTLSIVRYYLAGLSDSGSGGFEAIQGVTRVVGAAGFIAAWPGVFNELVLIPKMFDSALLGSSTVQSSVATLFDAALVVGAGAFALGTGIGLIFVLLMGLVAAIIFIALLWMKVLLSVMMMFLFCTMPLCVVMWPVPELSWVASAAMRSMFVALLVPCVWAIVFALSAAVNTDVLSWAPPHNIVDSVVIRPLAGLTLMMLCISLPRFLVRTAMIGPAGQARGGWRIWRTVTFGLFAMRGVSGAARTVAAAANEGNETAQRLIDRLPQQAKPPGAPGEGGLAGRIIFGRSGFGQGRDEPGVDGDAPPLLEPEGDAAGAAVDATEAAATAATEQTPSAGGEAPAGQPAPSHQDTQAAGEQPAAAEQPPGSGEATPATSSAASAGTPGQPPARDPHEAELIDRAGAGMYHDAHSAGSSKEAVADAIGQLRPAAQARVAEIAHTNPEKLRDQIARTLHNPQWTEGERDALWTIGSARRQEVNEGIALAEARREESADGDTGATATAQPAGAGDGRSTTPPADTASSPTPAVQQPPAPNGQAPPPAGPPPEDTTADSGPAGGLIEQPPPTSDPPAEESPDIPDSEPFLD